MKDSKFYSRKFLFAGGTFTVVSFIAVHAETMLAADAGDTALILGAAGAVFGVILKLYNDANLEDKKE